MLSRAIKDAAYRMICDAFAERSLPMDQFIKNKVSLDFAHRTVVGFGCGEVHADRVLFHRVD